MNDDEMLLKEKLVDMVLGKCNLNDLKQIQNWFYELQPTDFLKACELAIAKSIILVEQELSEKVVLGDTEC